MKYKLKFVKKYVFDFRKYKINNRRKKNIEKVNRNMTIIKIIFNKVIS